MTGETENQPVTAQKPHKKAAAGARRANTVPAKGKARKKAKAPKNALRTPKQAGVARDRSKTARILELLKHDGGASVKELMKATGWQAHSVRGFLSGTVRKKMGLTVASAKAADGGRSYSVKA
jgi:hypothetical protein